MSRRLLLIAMLLAGSAHAAMYKWVDAEGNVQYTAFPPPDRPATTIAPPPRVAPPATPAPKPTADRAVSEPADESDASDDRLMAELNKRNCGTARKNLDIFRTARRIRQGDEHLYLDDASRAKGIADAQADIEKYCK